jgi:hypothetical protein
MRAQSPLVVQNRLERAKAYNTELTAARYRTSGLSSNCRQEDQGRRLVLSLLIRFFAANAEVLERVTDGARTRDLPNATIR